MAKAQELIADYKADNPGPLNVRFATTNDETNLTVAQFRKQWWEEAGVDNVSIDQIDQGAFIVATLLGDFQSRGWRQHSGIDLDAQYIWWHSSSALPQGELALNFGRIKDPVIDEALDANRGETDPAKKQEYAETSTGASRSSATTSGPTGTSGGSPTNPRSTAWRTSPCPEASQSIFGAGIGGTFYHAHVVGRAVIGVPA